MIDVAVFRAKPLTFLEMTQVQWERRFTMQIWSDTLSLVAVGTVFTC